MKEVLMETQFDWTVYLIWWKVPFLSLYILVVIICICVFCVFFVFTCEQTQPWLVRDTRYTNYVWRTFVKVEVIWSKTIFFYKLDGDLKP